jgi:hypothetical protein
MTKRVRMPVADDDSVSPRELVLRVEALLRS